MESGEPRQNCRLLLLLTCCHIVVDFQSFFNWSSNTEYHCVSIKKASEADWHAHLEMATSCPSTAQIWHSSGRPLHSWHGTCSWRFVCCRWARVGAFVAYDFDGAGTHLIRNLRRKSLCLGHFCIQIRRCCHGQCEAVHPCGCWASPGGCWEKALWAMRGLATLTCKWDRRLYYFIYLGAFGDLAWAFARHFPFNCKGIAVVMRLDRLLPGHRYDARHFQSYPF